MVTSPFVAWILSRPLGRTMSELIATEAPVSESVAPSSLETVDAVGRSFKVRSAEERMSYVVRRLAVTAGAAIVMDPSDFKVPVPLARTPAEAVILLLSKPPSSKTPDPRSSVWARISSVASASAASSVESRGFAKETLEASSVTSPPKPWSPPVRSERDLRMPEPNLPEPLKSMLE